MASTLTRWAAMGLLSASAIGCVDASETPPGQSIDPLAQLIPAGTCDDLRDQLASRALTQMEQLIKRNEALATQPCGEFDNGGEAPGVGTPASVSGGARSASNVQVAGVDEADLIETDGTHLYVLTEAGLEILTVWPPEAAAHLVTLPLPDPGVARGLFVDGDRAVIYVDRAAKVLPEADLTGTFGPYGVPPAVGGLCPFGIGCEFSGNNRALQILTVDVADPSAPRIIRNTRLNGSYVAARRIGEAVHTVVDFPPPVVRGVRYWPEGLPDRCGVDPEVARAAFDTLRAENVRVLTGRPLADWLPAVTDVRGPGAPDAREVSGLLEACDSVWYAHLQSGRGFVSVLSQTMRGDQRLSAETIVGEPGAVYASGEALYIATRRRLVADQAWFSSVPDNQEATVVHRFALRTERLPLDANGRPVVDYQGSVAVPGLLLNRFALDERAGALRVLSTVGFEIAETDDPITDYAPEYGDVVSVPHRDTGHAPTPDRSSRLTVLDTNRVGRLAITGWADALAANRDLGAVRYLDEWALLSFADSGRLQLVDLRDPSKPQARGSVDTEGTPRFLHPLASGQVLAVSALAPQIEETRDENGDVTASVAGPGGLALSLLDLSDADQPRVVGEARYASARSAALSDPLALSAFPQAQALAVPVQQCAPAADTDGLPPAFDGLAVFDVTASGFAERGRIDHLAPDGACDDAPQVQRSVFIEDSVVSVGRTAVHITGLSDLGPRGRVALEGRPVRPSDPDEGSGEGGGMGGRDDAPTDPPPGDEPPGDEAPIEPPGDEPPSDGGPPDEPPSDGGPPDEGSADGGVPDAP